MRLCHMQVSRNLIKKKSKFKNILQDCYAGPEDLQATFREQALEIAHARGAQGH